LPLGDFRPVGDTDSEYAFCALLHYLRSQFPAYPRSRRALYAAVAEFGARMGRAGTLNFLLGDGENLFARCATKLHYIIREAPFRQATLSDEDVGVDFSQVTTPTDRVAVIATAPLTCDETWHAGKPGTLWVFREGKLAATLASG
jgi:predicted glutamine amidotransferase